MYLNSIMNDAIALSLTIFMNSFDSCFFFSIWPCALESFASCSILKKKKEEEEVGEDKENNKSYLPA